MSCAGSPPPCRFVEKMKLFSPDFVEQRLGHDFTVGNIVRTEVAEHFGIRNAQRNGGNGDARFPGLVHALAVSVRKVARRDDAGDALFDQRFENGDHFLRVILFGTGHVTGHTQISRRVFHGVLMLLEVLERHQRRHEHIDFFLVHFRFCCCGFFRRSCRFRRGGLCGGFGCRFGACCEHSDGEQYGQCQCDQLLCHDYFLLIVLLFMRCLTRAVHRLRFFTRK